MIALDLFAGTGWGVACQRLGIEEYGVEIMPEARAVRAANGMKTWYADVWQGLEADVRRFDAAAFFDLYSLLIASPPCQTFSLAGGGTDPLALGGSGARKILKDARERGEWVDDRPATTVSGDARIWPPGHKVNADDERRLGAEARERYGDRAGTKAERVTIAEAAALQSYPPGFVWDAEVVDPRTKKLKPITKTKTFLQIGNAVPPLLAEAILVAATGRPSHA